MHTDFWLERWQKNQIGFHEQNINGYLQQYWGCLNLPAGSVIFVPLCGKSLDILWLLSEGYQVVAVELSPIAVNSFFSENNLSATIIECEHFSCWQADGLSIYQGNFFDLGHQQLQECTAIYDRAALVALPENLRQQYIQHLIISAPNIKQSLLISLEYAQDKMQGPPFSVAENEVQHLFRNTWDIKCLLAEESIHRNDNFKQRGLNSLVEKIYRLSKHAPSL